MKICLRDNDEPYAEMEEMMDRIVIELPPPPPPKVETVTANTPNSNRYSDHSGIGRDYYSNEKPAGQKRAPVPHNEYNPHHDDYYAPKHQYNSSNSFGYHPQHGYNNRPVYRYDNHPNDQYQRTSYYTPHYDNYPSSNRKQTNQTKQNYNSTSHYDPTDGYNKSWSQKNIPAKRQTMNTSTTYYTNPRQYKKKTKNTKKKQKKVNAAPSWDIPTKSIKKSF